MRALLWKDYRLNRGLLVMGLVLAVAPYMALVAWELQYTSLRLANVLLSACFVSMTTSLVTLVTLAGNAIAGERVERAAEFLAALPTGRRDILASKFIVAASAPALIWAANLLVAMVGVPLLDAKTSFHHDEGGALWFYLIGLALLFFGAGWLWSALVDSPALATGIGLGQALALTTLPFLLDQLGLFTATQARLAAAFALVGILSLAFGSIHYLRQVEP